ncbi:MAG: EcsC family protein [Polyangiales bacterium]
MTIDSAPEHPYCQGSKEVRTMGESENGPEEGGRLLKAVQAVAISPADARQVVAGYRLQGRRRGMSEAATQQFVAERIVARYAKLAATSGATTALTGVIPGIGTAAALVGGGAVDTVVSIKLQVDMCMCLADAFGHDVTSQDAQHLSYVVALGGALEQAGREVAVKVGSKAGVRIVRQYLKGATLIAIKELFRRIGIVFTRKALERAIPFGVGVVVGGSTNYVLTKYVGNRAREFFATDAEMRAEGDVD